MASSVTLSASDTAEYDQHIKHLQRSYASHKWFMNNVVSLLELTAFQRRLWISKDSPPVKEVIEKFSCLREPKIVKLHVQI